MFRGKLKKDLVFGLKWISYAWIFSGKSRWTMRLLVAKVPVELRTNAVAACVKNPSHIILRERERQLTQ